MGNMLLGDLASKVISKGRVTGNREVSLVSESEALGNMVGF